MRDKKIDFLFMTVIFQPPMLQEAIRYVGMGDFTFVTEGEVGILVMNFHFGRFKADGSIFTEIGGVEVSLVVSCALIQGDRIARATYLSSGANFRTPFLG